MVGLCSIPKSAFQHFIYLFQITINREKKIWHRLGFFWALYSRHNIESPGLDKGGDMNIGYFFAELVYSNTTEKNDLFLFLVTLWTVACLLREVVHESIAWDVGIV